VADTRYIGFGKESVYGTPVGAGRYIESTEDIKPTQGWIIPSPIASRGYRKRNLGAFRWRGPIGPFSLEPENAGEFMISVLGSVTTTNPYSGVYLHVFTPADTLPSLTIRIGAEQTERLLPSSLIDKLGIKFEHGQDIKIQPEVVGGRVLEGSYALGTPTFSSLQAFQSVADYVKFAGTDYKGEVYAAELTIDNKIPLEKGNVATRFFDIKRYGERKVTGKISAYFDSMHERDRFLAGSEFLFEAMFKGPLIVGSYYYEFYLIAHKCVYIDDGTPHIKPKNEPLVIDAPFQAFWDKDYSIPSDVLLKLQNTIPSY
jgi:hypothetical protein